MQAFKRSSIGDPDATGHAGKRALLDETAGYAKGPSAVVPVPMDVQRRNYPEISAVGPYFQAQHHKRIFDAGVEILLEGIRKEAEGVAMR